MVTTGYGLAEPILEEASQIGGVVSEFALRAEGVETQIRRALALLSWIGFHEGWISINCFR